MTVTKKHQEVNIVLQRAKGSDGKISCMIKTDPVHESATAGHSQNAVEYEDYLPKHELITFEHGEQEKIVPI